jgi:hypothetical protein
MSTPPKKIIVVAGANGRTGKLVCDSLLSRSRVAGQPVLVRGLVRKGSSHPVPSAIDGDQQLVFESVDYDSDDDLNRVCAGAYAVVSTLQGVEDVLVGVQSKLLRAAIKGGARRFIPSDYSIDFTVLPRGTNRNFEIRLAFHESAARIIKETGSSIALTTIFQGAFTELFSSGRVLVDFKKRRVIYFGSPDTQMDFTTWADTAEYTAAVALDANPTPFKLCISGARLTPTQVQQLASRVTGVDFALKRMASIGGLRFLIKVVRFFKPGTGSPLPIWVGMQYALAQSLGMAVNEPLANDRYPDIRWNGPEDIIRRGFEESKKS